MKTEKIALLVGNLIFNLSDLKLDTQGILINAKLKRIKKGKRKKVLVHKFNGRITSETQVEANEAGEKLVNQLVDYILPYEYDGEIANKSYSRKNIWWIEVDLISLSNQIKLLTLI